MLALTARLLVPGALLIYAVAYYWSVRDLPAEASLLPELMLALLAVLIALDAFAELRAWMGSKEAGPGEFQRAAAALREPRAQRIAVTMALTFAWLFFGIVYLGFFASTAIFISVGLLGLGERRYWLILLLTIAAVAICYSVFSAGLGLRLPKGPFF